ncbi:AI-2E family transporter [Alkalinema pantanalense]|uniref:AI-2E family transporter n=1 Tax=Alkalinema pantanalense TaxID=1620705 RepID=UPI003D6EB1E0
MMQQTNRWLTWWETVSPLGKVLAIALAIPLLVVNIWAISTVFEYFNSLFVIVIAASLLAFLLNYPVTLLQLKGNNRERASIVVFLLSISLLLALGVTLVPLALAQAEQLISSLPKWIDSGKQQLLLLNMQLENMGVPLNLDLLTEQIVDRLKSQLQAITEKVLNLALFTVTSLLDSLLTLVLTFYLLQHGDELWESLIDWLPVRIRQPFSQTLRVSFQNFFLGQFILATSLGSILTLAFLWLRVPFGLLFGLTIGTMALVPFGGSVGIALVTLLVALRDIWLGVKVLATAVLVQQIIENIIAPRVLSSITGLNPVWVFISILTGARVGGLLGVIIAVPTAVVIKTALGALKAPTSEIAANPDNPAIVETRLTTETADNSIESSKVEATKADLAGSDRTGQAVPQEEG